MLLFGSYLLGGISGIVVGFVAAHIKNGDPPWRWPAWMPRHFRG